MTQICLNLKRSFKIVPHKFDWIQSTKERSKQQCYKGKLKPVMVISVMLSAVHVSINKFYTFLFLFHWNSFCFTFPLVKWGKSTT